MNKNRGISFDDYIKLVVAELAIAGYSREEDYPSEDEVREDWQGDKTPKECADSFIAGWKSVGIEPIGEEGEANENQS
jgi:hypothetical protein